jgi:hypothetical protein
MIISESVRSISDNAVCAALGIKAVRGLVSDESNNAFSESRPRFPRGNETMLGFDHNAVSDTAPPSVLERPSPGLIEPNCQRYLGYLSSVVYVRPSLLNR